MAKAVKDVARQVPARDARGRYLPADPGTDLAISITHKGAHAGRLQVRKRRCTGWTEAKREEFLEALADGANIIMALTTVRMSRSGLTKLNNREPDFKRRVESALEEAYARLELALLQRARFGVEQPVYHAGEKVGAKVEYPDGMGLKLLRLHKETAASVRARRIDPAVADADRDAVFIALRARIELARTRRTGQGEPQA